MKNIILFIVKQKPIKVVLFGYDLVLNFSELIHLISYKKKIKREAESSGERNQKK